MRPLRKNSERTFFYRFSGVLKTMYMIKDTDLLSFVVVYL